MAASSERNVELNTREAFPVFYQSLRPYLGNMKSLLPWIRDSLLRDRPELFLQGETIRPGILVLVNDADWELLGDLEYEIQPNDRIVFISTLHGG